MIYDFKIFLRKGAENRSTGVRNGVIPWNIHVSTPEANGGLKKKKVRLGTRPTMETFIRAGEIGTRLGDVYVKKGEGRGSVPSKGQGGTVRRAKRPNREGVLL